MYTVSKTKWIILFGFAIAVDAIQILIGLTGFGIFVSESLEFVTGPAIIGLCVIFKIHIFSKPKRIASLLLITLGDSLTGGFAPFWVVDVWYIYHDVKKEEAAARQQIESEDLLSNEGDAPANENGIRLPRKSILRQGGVPGGMRQGLIPGGIRQGPSVDGMRQGPNGQSILKQQINKNGIRPRNRGLAK